jgi:hypothetical protein
VLTNLCVTKLIACRAVMPPGSDYGAIGARVAGAWGAAAVNAALVLSQAGFCCVYISFIARNLIQLFNDGGWGCWVTPDALWLFVACEFLVLAPLTWVRRLSSFAPTNLAANALILTGIAGVLAFSVGGMAGGGGEAAGLAPLPAVASRWPLMLGTAVYAFEGAGMVVPLVNELPPGDRARFPRVFALTLAGVSALYLVVGLVPYLYLVRYAHADVQDTITLNLPHVWWSYGLTAGRGWGAKCEAQGRRWWGERCGGPRGMKWHAARTRASPNTPPPPARSCCPNARATGRRGAGDAALRGGLCAAATLYHGRRLRAAAGVPRVPGGGERAPMGGQGHGDNRQHCSVAGMLSARTLRQCAAL